MPGYEAMEEVHVHTHMYLDRYGRVVSTPKYFFVCVIKFHTNGEHLHGYVYTPVTCVGLWSQLMSIVSPPSELNRRFII